MSIPVTILDSDLQKIEGLTIEREIIRDGLPYRIAESTDIHSISSNPGSQFVLLSDRLRNILSELPDSLRITGILNRHVLVSADYSVAADSCHCHVKKYSGVDTVIVPAELIMEAMQPEPISWFRKFLHWLKGDL